MCRVLTMLFLGVWIAVMVVSDLAMTTVYNYRVNRLVSPPHSVPAFREKSC